MPLSLSTPSQFGFSNVLGALRNANRVAVVTWSIDTDPASELVASLRSLNPSAHLTLITNVPNRFPSYWSESAREKAADVIAAYLRAVAPQTFRCKASVYFCFRSHAKIVASESVAYVGSANFTTASKGNFESGFLTHDPAELDAISSFVDRIKASSIPYFELQDSPSLQTVLILLSEFSDIEAEVWDSCHEYSYNDLTDNYDYRFDIDKFAVPKSVSEHLKALAKMCEDIESRASREKASMAETHFAEQNPAQSCRELLADAEFINGRHGLPKPIDTQELDSSLRRELGYLERDGNADEIAGSTEYLQRWHEALEKRESERVEVALQQIKRFLERLTGLREKLHGAFYVNPQIDNASHREAAE